MLCGDVLTLNTDGSVQRQHVGSIAAALRPRAHGGFVVAVERGFALDDGAGSPLQVLPEIWTDHSVRMNEGACDPHGRFYCGSMAYDAHPSRGCIYRLDPDRTVTTVLADTTISNGLAWSPDGNTAYYIDTPKQCVDAFDYDEVSGLTNRRTAVTIPARAGSPDGLTVDEEGGLWVALWGGGAVHRYLPSGRLIAVIELPVTQVSACAFGGDRLDQLFITTSRHGLAPQVEPASGSLFRIELAVHGLPTHTFGG
jgi:sugar lactone lactonase YvrE